MTMHTRAAGHCMIFARSTSKVLDEYDLKAIVLMQMRFDGRLGFAGGMIDEDDGSSAEGVSRELYEEMGVDPKKYPLSEENHIISQPVLNDAELDVLHFYALQIPEHNILELEKNTHTAIHYGEEVLGWVRVPLYTMKDGYNGLPAFLNNNFAGNSRDQLLLGLEKTGVLTPTEIKAAKEASSNHKK